MAITKEQRMKNLQKAREARAKKSAELKSKGEKMKYRPRAPKIIGGDGGYTPDPLMPHTREMRPNYNPADKTWANMPLTTKNFSAIPVHGQPIEYDPADSFLMINSAKKQGGSLTDDEEKQLREQYDKDKKVFQQEIKNLEKRIEFLDKQLLSSGKVLDEKDAKIKESQDRVKATQDDLDKRTKEKERLDKFLDTDRKWESREDLLRSRGLGRMPGSQIDPYAGNSGSGMKCIKLGKVAPQMGDGRIDYMVKSRW